MGKIEKIYQKAKNSPNNLQFDELCHLAEGVGFKMRKRKGKGSSHKIYKHPVLGGMMNFQKDKNGKATPYQVRQLLHFIETNRLINEGME